MAEPEELRAARAELERAVHGWLRVKAAVSTDPEDQEHLTSDPVSLGWALVSVYTSASLEQEGSTMTVYEVSQDQPAPFTAGLFGYGVKRFQA